MYNTRSSDTSPRLKAAQGYAKRGKPIFAAKNQPGHEDHKRPHYIKGILENGLKSATTDLSRVSLMFNRHPDALIAMATGRPSRVWILDVDKDRGGFESLSKLEERCGKLPQSVRVRTYSGGLHIYFLHPMSFDIRTGVDVLGSGLDVRGDGGYVIVPAPGTGWEFEDASATVTEAPDWLAEAVKKQEPASASPNGHSTDGLESTELNIESRDSMLRGGTGPIAEGTRNDTLTSIAGRLHDGSRDLAQLTSALAEIRDKRCENPATLPDAEVAKIAKSIHARKPCAGGAAVTETVLAMCDYLDEKCAGRPIKGKPGATGWSLTHAAIEAARKWGREAEGGIEVSLDYRTWAQMAGVGSTTTVSDFVKRSPLVQLISRGRGRRRSKILLVVPKEVIPKGGETVHSTTRGVSKENSPPLQRSEQFNPLLMRTLYRMRWSSPSAKSRRGVVRDTVRVRENVQPARDGISRPGKSKAALLAAVVDCPKASRKELADRLGLKPDSLKKPLRYLMEAGLIVRVAHGRYEAAQELQQRLEDVRELGLEPEAVRLQIERHYRERNGYREWLAKKGKADSAPAPGDTRRRRENYPERRQAAIKAALMDLFADNPEYRSRRVGQITCQLPNYLPDDFPRGSDGLPKDAEVEAILDGQEVSA